MVHAPASGMINGLASALLAAIAMAFPECALATDCSPADITLFSQAEIDGFQADHGGGGTCDTVSGNLGIHGDSITNLDGLADLVTIEGRLNIRDISTLVELDGLDSLTRVGGDLVVYQNPELKSLGGFAALQEVGGDLELFNNYRATDVTAFQALRAVGGTLTIRDMVAWSDLNAFPSLTSVAQGLEIRDNNLMFRISGLNRLVEVGGDLSLTYNSSLTELTGMTQLVTVGGDFYLSNNELLTDISGLLRMTSVGGEFYAHYNPVLSDCSPLIPLLDPIDDPPPGPGPRPCPQCGPSAPDVGGAITLSANAPGCLSIAEILASSPPGHIHEGVNDAWYNPETDGQGFLIMVFPQYYQMFMAWFTYDTERPPPDVTAQLGEPGHRWITAQGRYRGDRAELDVWIAEGGVFNGPVPVPDRRRDGKAVVEFSGCNAGTVTYDITSIGMVGEVPIERVSTDNVPLCESLEAELLPSR